MLEEIRPPRRAVIAYAGLGALVTAMAACSTNDKPSESASVASTSDPAPTGAPATSGAAPLAKTADVPVGSGVIVDDTVITQPTAGEFKGFSPVCPHRGCNVDKITEGKIICPCHNSEFNLDGTVAQGPATTPLDPKPVKVQGDSIVAG